MPAYVDDEAHAKPQRIEFDEPGELSFLSAGEPKMADEGLAARESRLDLIDPAELLWAQQEWEAMARQRWEWVWQSPCFRRLCPAAIECVQGLVGVVRFALVLARLCRLVDIVMWIPVAGRLALLAEAVCPVREIGRRDERGR
ncbi:hypothetical protein [Nocardia sp. NPDC051570]|uniref:hypothetical protein n=1 Tax=Nocardia sp. NPDC051570 TaxID=3364324 RepID=UPI00379947C9